MQFNVRRSLLTSPRAEELLHQSRLDSVGHSSPDLRRGSEHVPRLVLSSDLAEFKRREFHRSHSRKSLTAAQGPGALRCTGNGDYVRRDGILPVFIRHFIRLKEDILVLCNGAANTWSRCILPSRLCASRPPSSRFAEP